VTAPVSTLYSLYSISGARKATVYELQIWPLPLHSQGPGIWTFKSPFKILKKRERGRIQGLPKVLKYTLLFQELVKLRTSNFVCIFIGWIGYSRGILMVRTLNDI